MKDRFVHLHCHTNHSLLEGASHIDDLILAAKERGMEALAITDTNGMYGAIPFFKAAKEKEIKPIIGAEVSGKTEDNEDLHGDVKQSAVLLARDTKGYSTLCRIITERALKTCPCSSTHRYHDDDPHHADTRCHCCNPYHPDSAHNGNAHGPDGKFSIADALIKRKSDIEGHLFILTHDTSLLHALSPHLSRETLFAEITNFDTPESRKQIRELLALVGELHLETVATNDIHFAEHDGYRIHRILRAIDLNTTLSLLPTSATVSPEASLKSEDEMRKLFETIPEPIGKGAIANAARIADACSFEFEIGKFSFPAFPLPEGETPFSHLWKLCFGGASKRYSTITPAILERLRYEITVIEALGFSGYFIIVNDIANHARKAGIPLIGRGSAANSIVSYCLGLTNVDPLEHDLYFERFLNPERTSPPDIDLDFCWRRRDDILDYVYKRYGDEYVAMISTHVTFAWRSSIREVAKVLGVPEDEIGKFTKKIPHWGVESIEEAVKKIPECRNLSINEEPFRTVIEIAKKIEGYPRHLSVHAGGIVIGEKPLTEYLPLERAAKGLVVTQFDMFSVEDVGLVKIDLLCQRSLSVREDTLREVEKNYGERPDIWDLPMLYSDGKTVDLIRNGKTIGCFYIESPAMRGLLKKLDVSSFEMLTAASSVIRPGVAESGMMQQFIRRHRGEEPVTYLHPKLEKLLGSTYGVMIYQEDVIRVAHELAGMTLAEADMLRRGMSGKERSPEAMKETEKKFIRSCMERDVREEAARELWRQIASFAGYAFCKAHSASYAQLSFQVAYLKAHYPAEFMAAVLSNQGGFYHTSVYIEEARRLGLSILPPDINRSEYHFTAKKDDIRIGLLQIKGLSRKSIDAIISERKNGWFTSLRDLLERVRIAHSEIRLLILAGCLDSFELTRPELLWKLETLTSATKNGRSPSKSARYRRKVICEEVPKNDFLNFGYFNSLRCARDAVDLIVPRIPDFTFLEKLETEMELFEFTVSAHPIELYREKLNGQRFLKSTDIPHHKGKIVRVIGWLDAVKRTSTSKGEQMKFITFEDKEGIIEATLFPVPYRRYGHLLNGRGPYIVTGKVEEDAGFYTLTITSLKTVQR